MLNFTCTFYAVPVVEDNNVYSALTLGYKIGEKGFNNSTSFKAAINTAFSKTLPGGDTLRVDVDYNTKRGINTVQLTSANYSTVLAAIDAAIAADKMSLDTLLA